MSIKELTNVEICEVLENDLMGRNLQELMPPNTTQKNPQLLETLCNSFHIFFLKLNFFTMKSNWMQLLIFLDYIKTFLSIKPFASISIINILTWSSCIKMGPKCIVQLCKMCWLFCVRCGKGHIFEKLLITFDRNLQIPRQILSPTSNGVCYKRSYSLRHSLTL